MTIRFLSALTALLVFVGCSPHQMRTVTPPAPLPPSFSQFHEGELEERWWLAFNDPQLTQLIEVAFKHNRDLAQAMARLEQAEALVDINQAARMPSLDLQGQAKREKMPGILGDHTGNSSMLSLSAAFEPDIWQKLGSQVHSAELSRDAAREDVKTFFLTLAARVGDFYYLAAEQKAQLELTDQTIESFAETLSRVEQRYRQGLVPALDVYQSRQNLATAKARRPQYEQGLAEARHALAVLLGRYPGDLPAGSIVSLPAAPESFPSGLPSQLLTRRPDIRAALARVEASDADVASAVADRFPSLNLLADYGRSRSSTSSGIITGDFWSLILNAAMPLFDAGRRKAEVARNEARFREQLAGYHNSVLIAFQEVEDALSANHTTERRISRLQEQVDATEASLRVALDRYTFGLSDYLPVLTAQTAQFTAQSELLSARRQLLSDRITLARSLGGQWPQETLARLKNNDELQKMDARYAP
ncbi:efflux transporter outer membrane subunit [Geoalkalibacter subterraneus]|uniref:RND transporter n=1 Tax=Geoalkalibacter subterraneus TaxID=483547 RepID=A0A0B5FH18_9BACT|nr:efflux transporter outer membrane subunit [Geoalkalibacter subterraneus]AJF07447.1 hypothetical protein GSUB_14000 [Geoalkalibacter subterraneus]